MFTCEARLSKGDGESQAVWPSGSPLQITTKVILSLRKFQPQGLPRFGCALGWPGGGLRLTRLQIPGPQRCD